MEDNSLNEHFEKLENNAPILDQDGDETKQPEQAGKEELVGEPNEEPKEELAEEPKEEPEGEPVEEKEEYQPDFTYKVKDEIKEIDEEFRSLITSKEMEDKVKTLFSKSAGLDEVSKSRDNFREKYETTTKDYGEYKKNFDPAIAAYQKGEYLESARMLGYEEDQILAMAQQILNYQQATPEEKAKIQRETQLKQEHFAQENQYNTQKQELEKLKVQNIVTQTNFELSKPEVKEISEYVNTKSGDSQAFEREVYEYGDLMYKRGQEVTPQEAVMAVTKKYKPFIVKQPVNTQKTQNTQPSVKKGKIPTVKSAGTPGRRVIQSMDDWDKVLDDIGG